MEVIEWMRRKQDEGVVLVPNEIRALLDHIATLEAEITRLRALVDHYNDGNEAQRECREQGR